MLLRLALKAEAEWWKPNLSLLVPEGGSVTKEATGG